MNSPATADPAAAGADPVAAFERHRAFLRGLAYRFLGSVADAEDIVQETWLRWSAADRAAVGEPRAYLARIAARLCLDQLKSARARREQYVGPWLPEPVLAAADFAAAPASAAVDFAEDISVALMLTLERLTPLERAAFLLHDVFGLGFGEIAAALGRSAAACRQLATRARSHVRASRPRMHVAPEEGRRVVAAFERALRDGDVGALTQVLADDAVLHSDGGGKVIAARRPILGRDRIVRFLAGIARKKGAPRSLDAVLVNGLPGLLMRDALGHVQTYAFDVREGRVAAVYVVRNPDKLRHVHAG